MLIFLVCGTAGYIKAAAVLKRKHSLATVCRCLTDMKNRLRYEGNERLRLISEAFSGSGLLEISNGEIIILPCGLSENDCSVLYNLFDSFGSGDLNSEIERIELFLSVFEQKRQDADTNASQQVKLYRTLGICAGAVICLIFI